MELAMIEAQQLQANIYAELAEKGRIFEKILIFGMTISKTCHLSGNETPVTHIFFFFFYRTVVYVPNLKKALLLYKAEGIVILESSVCLYHYNVLFCHEH